MDYKLLEQIKRGDIQEGIKLFPNPCNDRIYIEEITIYEGAHYSFILYNLMGDKVKTLTPVGNEIVLNQVESGSYFYALQNSSIVLLRGKLIVIKAQ